MTPNKLSLSRSTWNYHKIKSVPNYIIFSANRICNILKLVLSVLKKKATIKKILKFVADLIKCFSGKKKIQKTTYKFENVLNNKESLCML